MTVKTPSELIDDINSTLTSNNRRAITATDMRSRLIDMVDTLPISAYAADQIADASLVSPVERDDPTRWSSRLAIAGKDFGIAADGTTNDAPAINAIMAALAARGGGRLQLPSANIAVGAPLDNKYSHVLVEGAGRVTATYGTPALSTTIIPTFAGTVLSHRTPYGSASTPLNNGGGFVDMQIIGNGIATRLLDANMVWGGKYHLTLREAAGTATPGEGICAAFNASVSPSQLAGICMQQMDIDLFVTQTDVAANAKNVTCVAFSGSATSNVSINSNIHLDGSHFNGHFLYLQNADNNFFFQRSFCYPTGTGRCIFSGGGTSDALRARGNYWAFLSANTAPLFQGTGGGVTFPSTGEILLLDADNGSPPPEKGTGASCPVRGSVIAYTPVVTASSGAITSYTATGRYAYIGGRKVQATVTINITNNGTGAGILVVSLPEAQLAGSYGQGTGADVVNGPDVSAIITSSLASVRKTTNDLYPVVTGSVLIIDLFYEAI